MSFLKEFPGIKFPDNLDFDEAKDTKEVFYEIISIFGHLMLEEKTKDILYISQLQQEIEKLKEDMLKKNEILDNQLSIIKDMNKKYKHMKRNNQKYGLTSRELNTESPEDYGIIHQKAQDCGKKQKKTGKKEKTVLNFNSKTDSKEESDSQLEIEHLPKTEFFTSEQLPNEQISQKVPSAQKSDSALIQEEDKTRRRKLPKKPKTTNCIHLQKSLKRTHLMDSDSVQKKVDQTRAEIEQNNAQDLVLEKYLEPNKKQLNQNVEEQKLEEHDSPKPKDIKINEKYLEPNKKKTNQKFDEEKLVENDLLKPKDIEINESVEIDMIQTSAEPNKKKTNQNLEEQKRKPKDIVITDGVELAWIDISRDTSHDMSHDTSNTSIDEEPKLILPIEPSRKISFNKRSNHIQLEENIYQEEETEETEQPRWHPRSRYLNTAMKRKRSKTPTFIHFSN